MVVDRMRNVFSSVGVDCGFNLLFDLFAVY